MININYEMVVNDELLKGNIDNKEFDGFFQDYRVLHCLLKRYSPKIFFEVGTNFGVGTKIIKNALGDDSEVYSLDLPVEDAHISLKNGNIGSRCDLPYTQLSGDSLNFDYTKYYSIDGWFIDGEHDYQHPKHEAAEAIKSGANIIIFHDANIECVGKAIDDAFSGNEDYLVFRVQPTRVAYAIKK